MDISGGQIFGYLIVGAVLYHFLLKPIINGYREGVRDDSSGGGPGTSKAFAIAVVGESNYQGALSALCGGRSPDGVEKYFMADLVPEDANPHDSNAVRVDIQGKTVGYLAREQARTWRVSTGGRASVRCSAAIRGGWDSGGGDEGMFGVWLDVN